MRNRRKPLRAGHLRCGRGLPAPIGVASLAGALSAAVVAAVPAAAAPAPGNPGIPHLPGVGMLVTPPRLVVAASQVAKVQQLEIENRGSVRLDINTQLEGVSQRADGSTLVEPNAPYSAVNWVTVAPDHFQVGTGTRRYIHVRFRVPSNAEPGDHNVAIIFMEPPMAAKKSNSNAGQQSNVRIADGIGVPALITVPGPVIDDVSITRLKAPGFSAGGPIPLAATVRESGDVHHSFVGAGNRLEARAGRAIVMFPPFAVLRGSTVTLAAKWTHPPLMCVCHLTTAVATGGHRSIATATVVIFPLVRALAALAALAALVVAFLLLRRRQGRRLAAAYEAGRQAGLDDGAPPD
ncbi:MAG TPA: hypothetical protein VLW50_03480 [Streptosporangiaceae bacterium]|nr:hypothetical protein [Streptosporangiaceae bacterium]